MTTQEKRTTLYIASIYTFRMLGLFMILPIFSLYAGNFAHATPELIGLALGIYGLTQACLQIPFAMTSDRIGRKPVIVIGLILFIIGSIIAANAHSIYTIILGRAIQGAGAIGSTLMALIADTTEEQNRLKAMALVGMTIGFSFLVAMLLGPILNGLIGLSGIFWFTAVLASIGLIIITFLIPTPKHHLLHRDTEPVLSQFKKILNNAELLRLDFGIFTLHAMLMSMFIVIPTMLASSASIGINQQWMIYLPVLVVACILMLPFVIIAEAKRLMKPLFIAAIMLITFAQISLALFHQNIVSISIILCLFFAAFTFLEACLPSLISKITPAGNKGTAMGIYSSAQFLGIFFGGSLGGIILTHTGITGIFIFCALLSCIWAGIAITMKQPPYLSSKIISISNLTTEESAADLRTKLLNIPGIKDAMICTDEQVAYLKVDKKHFVETDLEKVMASK